MSTVRTINSSEVLYRTDDIAEKYFGDPAEAYHEASKLARSRSLRQTDAHFIQSNINALLTTTRATLRFQHLRKTELPAAQFNDVSFEEVLRSRRSKKDFGAKSISLTALSSLLFAANGVTGRTPLVADGKEIAAITLRTTPSGGALYPLDFYVAVHRVEGLAPGVYYFDPLDHALYEVRAGAVTQELSDACVYPGAVSGSAVTLLITSSFWRSRFKYRLRAYRNTLMEAGHAAQNTLLAAAALGICASPAASFYDTEIDDLLGLDGVNQGWLYAVCIGAE